MMGAVRVHTLRLPIAAFHLSFLLWVNVGAQSRPAQDGLIVERTAVPPPPGTYEKYVATATKNRDEEVASARDAGLPLPTPLVILDQDEWQRRQDDRAKVECFHLKYMSDGLKVAGYLWKPRDMDGNKLPLMIFNRGGNQEMSAVQPWSNPHRFALDGFVVMASQYRGNAGGEGREEFGGADVRDILNLVPAAASLGYVDMNNVFLFGWSRGGMMTYLALKSGMQVNAAAVGGGVADLLDMRQRRPSMGTNVFANLIPDYDTRAEEVLRERSAVFWPEKITAPLLILHGGADWRVDSSQALTLAQKLHEAGKPFELVVYDGDDHAISMNKNDVNQRVVAWFRKHMK